MIEGTKAYLGKEKLKGEGGIGVWRHQHDWIYNFLCPITVWSPSLTPYQKDKIFFATPLWAELPLAYDNIAHV